MDETSGGQRPPHREHADVVLVVDFGDEPADDAVDQSRRRVGPHLHGDLQQQLEAGGIPRTRSLTGPSV